jgi:4-diphosphocytidyl-2-C-methyl-D-erythritol kinase
MKNNTKTRKSPPNIVTNISSKAYAKINLGLRILRKRADGYHDIETIFHRVNIYDELTIEDSDSISLSCSDPNLASDESNLCYKAVKLLQHQSNCRRGVHITLTKNIPIGAGLGGGSSDAAATLLGVNRLWDLRISENDLANLALQLGSDVPYFLNSGTAYATGRGEILESLPFTLPYWIVIVYPNVQISTAWAYSNVHSLREEGAFSLKFIFQQHHGNVEKLSKLLKNDFEPVVKIHYPQVARILDALRFWGAEFAQLSGSGSAVYGIFSKKAAVDQFVRKAGTENRVFITPPRFTE